MNANPLVGKVILLVNPGSIRKKFIWERIKELGVTVIALNRAKTEPAEPYIDHWIIADLDKPEECLECVKTFVQEHSTVAPHGVITFWDESVFLVSQLAEAFGWVGLPLSTVDTIKNKQRFRRACRELELPAPAYAFLSPETNVDTLHERLKFPLVMKPVYGANSAFVVKVEHPSKLTAVWQSIKENLHKNELAPEWKNWDIFVEEYIHGSEVDIDILAQGGKIKYISITDNDQTHEPFFLETGERVPSRLAEAEQQALVTMAERTLAAFRLTDGCFHFEAKSTPNGPVPIEINLRMGGGDVYVFSKYAWGVDLIENAVRIACGILVTIQKPERPLTHLGSQQFLPRESGIVAELVIDECLKQKDYVVELYFQKKVGDEFLAPPQGYDSCLGWVTVQGSTAAEIEERLAEAMSHVRYRLSTPSTIHPS